MMLYMQLYVNNYYSLFEKYDFSVHLYSHLSRLDNALLCVAVVTQCRNDAAIFIVQIPFQIMRSDNCSLNILNTILNLLCRPQCCQASGQVFDWHTDDQGIASHAQCSLQVGNLVLLVIHPYPLMATHCP